MGGAEQHRLLGQGHAAAAVVQDSLHDEVHLLVLVFASDQLRRRTRRPLDQRSLVNRSAASPITLFEAARIGCGLR